MIKCASAESMATHIFKPQQYTIEDVFAFAESFINGGTEDFEASLTQAVRLIESEGFENADVVVITDGICNVSETFICDFREKIKQLKFSVTGIVIDILAEATSFNIEPFCEKVYRLSEMSGDDIASAIISSKVR